MDLRWMTVDDVEAVVAASVLFDQPATSEHTARFLREPTHHLCIAYLDETPAGFVSGIEMSHPDKGAEMFLYELGVGDRHRRRGVGRALVEALAALARERGCFGMWVLTDADNDAALRTYTAAGGGERSDHVMLEWRFS